MGVESYTDHVQKLQLTHPFLFFSLRYSYSLSTAGQDFVGFTQEFLFTRSNLQHCVTVSILADAVDEISESFFLEVTFQYAFDVNLDTYKVTIVDSGEVCVLHEG